VASGAATVLFTGAISISHGWFWLPATVLVKGQLPPITGPHSYLAFGGRWLKQLYGTPHLAVLIAGIAAISLYRTWPRLRPQSASDWMPVLAIGLVLLHLQFAATGGVMRYEAYLVALGVFVVASGAEYLLHHFQKTRRQAMAVGAIALALLAPLAARSMEGLKMVRHASHNIFEQQFQMAEFLSRNYKHASVAANDIGAITFFADIRCFDLAGLANLRVAQARWQRNYDTALMEEEAESRRVRLAVLYDSWFDGKFLPIAPRSWTPVERWTVPRNYVLGGATVTFYATHPGEVDELSRRLRDFDPRLPDGVTTWRR
jgi:hypothetical protein